MKIFENAWKNAFFWRGIETYYNARKAGFENISLDLMFSCQTKCERSRKWFEETVKYKARTFSIYSLIWEEELYFWETEKGLLRETENEIEADMFERIIDTAEKAGYIHYEISIFLYLRRSCP